MESVTLCSEGCLAVLSSFSLKEKLTFNSLCAEVADKWLLTTGDVCWVLVAVDTDEKM